MNHGLAPCYPPLRTLQHYKWRPITPDTPFPGTPTPLSQTATPELDQEPPDDLSTGPTPPGLHISTTVINKAGMDIVGAETLALITHLTQHPQFEDVILEGCNLDPPTVALLGLALSNNHRLSFLNLSNNNVHSTGAEAISLLLNTCPLLVQLKLHASNLNEVGMQTLGFSAYNTTTTWKF
jgi:hypothetical protein